MRKILIIIFVVLIVAAGGWYWYAKSRQTAPGVPAITDFGAFFPIGESGDPTLLDGVLQDPQTTQSGTQSTQTISPFIQLSPNPVAGFVSFVTPTSGVATQTTRRSGTQPVAQPSPKRILRYISRATGYVYEIKEGEIPTQISNIYIPNIYETLFGDKMNTALLRFLRSDGRTIATYSVPIPAENPDGTRTQKEGVYFPDNVLQATISTDGSQVAYLTQSSTGATISLSSLTNTKKLVLLQTPFREWLMSWPTPKALYLQTKASASVPGYLYRVDTTEKKLRKVLGGINGLTTSVSPNGTYVLYTQQSSSSFVTRIFNTKTNTTRSLTIAIMPEKCVWLQNEDVVCAGSPTVPEGQYPDAWYQGLVSFSDQLYRISTENLVYDTLYDNSGSSFDMTNLSLDETNRRIYFIDKKTGLLWQFSY